MLRIPFKWFECFRCLSSGSNLDLNASNPLKWFEFGFECFESLLKRIQSIRIQIRTTSNGFEGFEGFEFKFKPFERDLNANSSHSKGIPMLRIPFEWFKFEFERFESLSSGLNLDSNALTHLEVVRIWIRMLRILFEWFIFAFQCFDSLSSGSNLDSNVWNFIWMLWISFEWFEFEPLERDSKHSNSNLNHSKGIRSIRIQIRTNRKGIEAIECKLKPFEKDSKHSSEILNHSKRIRSILSSLNLDSNALNPFDVLWIWIRMLWIPFE